MTLDEQHDRDVMEILDRYFKGCSPGMSGCLKCRYHRAFNSRWLQIAEELFKSKTPELKIKWTRRDTGSFKILLDEDAAKNKNQS